MDNRSDGAAVKRLGSGSGDFGRTFHRPFSGSLAKQSSFQLSLGLQSDHETRTNGRVNGFGRFSSSSSAGRLTPGQFVKQNDGTRIAKNRDITRASSYVQRSSAMMTGLAVSAPGTTGAEGRAGGVSRPLVVHFSPSVVIRSGSEMADLEQRVVQAIERHSHELFQIIGREMESQRRIEF
jgi:hypothetical protein